MLAKEDDPLLPTHSTRLPYRYGINYWVRGFHLALPKTRSATRAKSKGPTDNDLKKGPSINKIGAIDTYYQEIRSLVFNLVTLFLSLGYLVIDCWSKRNVLVIVTGK
jgi:hypothetical protein